MIYLDNSATTYPKPEIVKRTAMNAISLLGANPGRGGYAMAEATSSGVYSVREKAAEFFGARGPENVIFTKNCTEALNQVIFGKLKAGDHVAVSDMEHNAVMRPIKALEAKGIECSVFTTYLGEGDKTLDSIRTSLKSNTKLVVCTAASNVFGIRLPIKRISALCHIYEIEICVDAAQAAGVIPIDMLDDGIDYLCVPSHKGLYGIMGAGMLISDKANSLTPLICGGTGNNSQSYFQPDEAPERFESGTLNIAGIMCIGSGIDFVKGYSIKKIHNNEMSKVQYLYKSIKACKDIELYTPCPTLELFVPVLSFCVDGKSSEEVGELLAKKGIAVRAGLHCAPSAHKKFGTENGTIRLSPSVFTTMQDMNTFIAQIKSIAKR